MFTEWLWRTTPIAETTTVDEYGEAKDKRIVARRIVYEIPFNKEFLRDLIEKSKEPVTNTCVGRGSDSPPDIISGNIMTVFNTEEFIEADFEDLVAANQGNFLKPEPGGIKAYIESRQQSKQQQANVVKS
jgi:hypothetical protein